MYQLTAQQHHLDQVLQWMESVDCYGIDTEFIKVDTLWPQLGVLQLNLDHKVVLLDGVNLDLSQIWQKVFQAKQNVFHACSEDIDLIYHYAQKKQLENVFDTQVAMAFLGHGLQVSYQKALKDILDIEIDKDQTRSNWLARPLSEDQLKYAANDVVYIMDLANLLREQLQEKQLYQAVLEDCQSLTYEIGTNLAQESLYLDVGNYRHSRRQLMQLQQLSLWRDEMIKSHNVPKSFVLKNSTMIDLVESNPKNNYQLAQMKDIRANVVREYGKTILELLKDLPEESQWPMRLSKPVKQASVEIQSQVQAQLQQVATKMDIPQEVLMRKKWMQALYQHVVFGHEIENLPSYLKGWRYDVLTAPLLDLLKKDVVFLSKQMRQ